MTRRLVLDLTGQLIHRRPLPRPLRAAFALSMALGVSVGCGADGAESTPDAPAWVWDLPSHVPDPNVPETNPMSEAKVELGRALVYDTRLSGNETASCASCHLQELAFTDGLGVALGSTGEFTARGAMSLANMAYVPRFNWANHLVDTLEAQALTPMFGDDPVELGMGGREDELVQRLAADDAMVVAFAEAFPNADGAITVANITRALSAFQRNLLSFDAPYDRFVTRTDTDALTDSARRGLDLFFSERLECFHCHGGVTFSDSLSHENLPSDEVAFHNTGVYNLDGDGAYPPGNRGIYELTRSPADMGRFRAPTLRNVEVTAPYFHDGSALTLDDVIVHYERGGTLTESGPNAGDGRESPLKSEFINGFIISDQERDDLRAFLESLTDQTFLTNPAYGPPD
jgi:cytochrome c peroxidase